MLSSVLSLPNTNFLKNYWPHDAQKTQSVPGVEGNPSFSYWVQKSEAKIPVLVVWGHGKHLGLELI